MKGHNGERAFLGTHPASEEALVARRLSSLRTEVERSPLQNGGGALGFYYEGEYPLNSASHSGGRSSPVPRKVHTMW